MDGGSRRLDIDEDESVAEQIAKEMYAKLERLRVQAREDSSNRRRAYSARQRLFRDLSQIGYVEMVTLVEQWMRDSGRSMDGPDFRVNVPLWKLIESSSKALEQGHWAEAPEEELEAGVKLIWSVLALLLAQGHDVRGAFVELARSEEDKLPPGVVPIINRDGTLSEPDGWKPPNFTEYVGF